MQITLAVTYYFHRDNAKPDELQVTVGGASTTEEKGERKGKDKGTLSPPTVPNNALQT